MVWKETHARLRESLRAELRKQWGRIAEIEDQVSCSQGHLNKLSSGANEFKLDVFLKTLDALGIDPRSFFSRALGIHPKPDDYLDDVDDGHHDDRALDRIVRATRQLEADEAESAAATAAADEGDVAEFLECSGAEQRRRLRHTRKYRSHAFVRAYLKALEILLYDDAVMTAKLAETVAVDLIPALPGPQRDRLALQCKAIGIFGSARRVKSFLSPAARALKLGIEVSRRHRLRAETARLQQRAAYVMCDVGHADRALALLSEAMVKYVELESQWDVGRILVDRGMILTMVGDYSGAVLALKRALELLEGSPDELRRNRLAAYTYLAYVFEHLDDLDAAERCLVRGVKAFGPRHAIDRAKLEWLRGTLAFKRGDLETSEKLLLKARSVLAKHENAAQGALITLDLVNTLLAQGKVREATEQAKSMAELLNRFSGSRFLEAAVVKFISAVLEGKLSQDLVAQARAKLEARRAP